MGKQNPGPAPDNVQDLLNEIEAAPAKEESSPAPSPALSPEMAALIAQSVGAAVASAIPTMVEQVARIVGPTASANAGVPQAEAPDERSMSVAERNARFAETLADREDEMRRERDEYFAELGEEDAAQVVADEPGVLDSRKAVARVMAAKEQMAPEAVERRIAQRREQTLAELTRLQRAQRAEILLAKQEGRKPRRLFSQPVTAPDRAMPKDRNGLPAGTDGYAKRWVRLRNSDREEDDSRYIQMQSEGYTVVRSKVDGKPIVGPFGILMQAHPDVEGDRQAHLQHNRVREDRAKGVDSVLGKRGGISTMLMADHGREVNVPDFPG